MAQEGFDTPMTRTDSRYRLSMVAARRADNAVTVTPNELGQGSGVRWGDDLLSAEAIRTLV